MSRKLQQQKSAVMSRRSTRRLQQQRAAGAVRRRLAGVEAAERDAVEAKRRRAQADNEIERAAALRSLYEAIDREAERRMRSDR